MCGYNLRGLRARGRCPECGTAVGFSLHGSLLRFSDPAWVETLASGANWIGTGVLLGLARTIATAMAGSSMPPSAELVASIMVGLVALMGFWKATTPEPITTGTLGISLRLVARFGYVGGFVLNVVETITKTLTWSPSAALTGFSFVFGSIWIFCICSYAAGLARRIPDRLLVRHTYVLMWVSLCMWTLFMIIGLMGTSPRGASGSWAPLYGRVCVAGLAMLILTVWAVVLVERYRKALSQAAAEARATWAAHAPEPL